jgi:hypothetical protein
MHRYLIVWEDGPDKGHELAVTFEQKNGLLNAGMIARCRVCDFARDLTTLVYHPQLANTSTWDDEHLPFTVNDIVAAYSSKELPVSETHFTEKSKTENTKGIKARGK